MSDETSLHGLAVTAIEIARQKGCRIVTAESCTSGALSTLLSDIPGAGEVLEGGFVSYSKSFKNDVLGVGASILEAETAVSGAVAHAMADGALRLCATAEIAIAVTGVCGPKPDDDGNPVGLAYLVVTNRNGDLKRKKLKLLPEASGRVRGTMIGEALELLASFLAEQN
ncbi:MAG TPA: CinA family protein [Hyphomicrobium sp.]|nr:CinA family protein [Hyphomicrobium sp.]